MGYLVNFGNTLTFNQSKPYLEQIKKDGITQLISLLKKYGHWDLENDQIKDKMISGVDQIYWGDELEAHIVELDRQHKRARIVVDLEEVYKTVNGLDGEEVQFKIVPEYGAWMIETTPKEPYVTLNNLEDVFNNLNGRRQAIDKHLRTDQHVLLTSTFQLLGQISHDYFISKEKPSSFNPENDEEKLKMEKEDFKNEITQSLFIDDRIINKHPRFPTLTRNIRERRGEKVAIKVPLFIDENTKTDETEFDPYPGYIYMDAMAFGMGSSCVQTTFSAKHLTHARWLYDQLGILSPLCLALTASSPILRGKLAAVDTRWDIISASVDCRNSSERDPTSEKYIPKSRYSSISVFASNDKRNLAQYTDLKFPLCEAAMKLFRDEAAQNNIEIDEHLVNHVGFLFARDPLVLFEKRITIDNETETAHFENIQSTNWNSVRLKPPPSLQETQIGWRVEFRTMESQISYHDNAAFILFSHILTRLLFQEETLNFYIPISVVDENFRRAKLPNAIIDQKFYFRVNIFEAGEPIIAELSLDEIFFGKEGVFQGLHGVAVKIWDEMMTKVNDQNGRTVFNKVWTFIKQKTSGQRISVAQWIRNFVLSHPEYKKDSIVTNEIGFDLITAITDISQEKVIDNYFQPFF